MPESYFEPMNFLYEANATPHCPPFLVFVDFWRLHYRPNTVIFRSTLGGETAANNPDVILTYYCVSQLYYERKTLKRACINHLRVQDLNLLRLLAAVSSQNLRSRHEI